jgi:predicted PurR-regulated permease PerM
MSKDIEPDNFEKGIRFGCGGLLGFVVGMYSFLHGFFSGSYLLNILSILFFVFLFGFLALKQGDKFWYSLKNWLWW